MGLWPLAQVKLEGRLPSSLHDKLTELPKVTDVAAMVTTGYPVGIGRRVNPYARPHPPRRLTTREDRGAGKGGTSAGKTIGGLAAVQTYVIWCGVGDGEAAVGHTGPPV